MRLPIVTPSTEIGASSGLPAPVSICSSQGISSPSPPAYALKAPTLFRAPRRWKVGSGIRRGLLPAHQVLHDEQLEALVVAGVDVALPRLAVDGVGEVDQHQEDFLGVLEVQVGLVGRLRAHR